MNQGYEVVETIAGHAVVPADEPLMQDKLLGMPGRPSVAEALQEIKAKVPLFQGLTTLQLREFLLDSEVHVRLAGEVIFERNGFGNTLFCIVAGTVEFELADDRNPAAPPRLASSGEGDFFGEAGLVAGRRRAGTARAKTDCVLVELARRSAIKLLNSVPAARELFERTTIVRQLQRDLSSALTEADLERVLASAEIKQFPTGAKLIEEGAPDDRSVYLIRSGSVTVARRIDGKEVVLAYRPVGHIVGEMALLRKAPRRSGWCRNDRCPGRADGHGPARARLLPGGERRSGGAGFTWRPVPAMNRCVAGQRPFASRATGARMATKMKKSAGASPPHGNRAPRTPRARGSPRSATNLRLAALGPVRRRALLGHGARGLQRRRRRLGLPAARPGAQQGLPLGRGRHRRHLRPLPAPRASRRPSGTGATRSSRSGSSA